MSPDTAQGRAATGRPRVFISAKSSDYDHAASVYDFLVDAGVCTFFSRQSLPELGSSDYRREIDNALDAAEHLVVVASSAGNVTASWVEAEWGFFINEKRSGRKAGNLVTVLVGGLQPGDLPPSLRYYEAIALDPAGLDKLLRYVQEPLTQQAPGQATVSSRDRLAFREVATLGGPPPIKHLAASSDDQALATGGLDGAVRVYDVSTRTRQGFMASERYRKARHEGLITALAFSPDKRLFASGHLDGSVHVWEIGRDEELPVEIRHDSAITGVAFCVNSRILATASRDAVLKMSDVGGRQEGRARHGVHRKPAPIVAVTHVNSKGWFAVGLVDTDSRRFAVQLHDMKAPHPVLATLGVDDAFVTLAVSADARMLAAGGGDGSVRLYDLAEVGEALARQENPKSLGPLGRLTGHAKPVSSLAVFRDNRAAVSSSSENKVLIWDLQAMKVAFRLQAGAGEQFTSAAVLAAGRMIATALSDGRIRLWEAT